VRSFWYASSCALRYVVATWLGGKVIRQLQPPT
jgi:hypothetical protein